MKMKNSTKNRVEGKARAIQGTLKEAVGVLAGSRRLKSEGRADAVSGKVQNQIGQAEKALRG
jgi:uncharacterized protein YjbJ (UPF0337 family)